MKLLKSINITRALLPLLLILATMPALAQETIINGIQYYCDSKTGTAMLVKGLYCGGDLVLPETVSMDGETYRVTAIYDNAFSGLQYLTSITVPESVVKIGAGAFSSCIGLKSVVLSKSITSLELGTFYECTNLTSVTFMGPINEMIPEIRFPCNPFYNCYNLKEIHISDLAAWCSIDFESSLKYKRLDSNNLENIYDTDNPLQYGGDLYLGDELITDLVIPDGVQKIGVGTFTGWKNLKSVTIPNSVTQIGNFAFYGCDNMTSLTLGESVDEIGTFSFYCENLTEINCQSVKPPFIPIYYVCDEYYYSDDSYRAYDAFSNYNATLTVPAESKELYSDDPLWGKFLVKAGADGVSAEDAALPTEYYNINGVKVAIAAPGETLSGLPSGVYITRRGSQSAKVFIP